MTAPIQGPSQEEATDPQMLDLVGLDILYYSISQFRPLCTADSAAIVETEFVPSIRPIMEQIESHLEFTSEPVFLPLVPLVAVTTDQMVITSLCFLTLIIELASSAMFIDPTSSVANMLISAETPPRLTISSAPLMTAPVTPSIVITTKPMEIFPSRITRSPGVIEVEKEFVVKLVDRFFKSFSHAFHWP